LLNTKVWKFKEITDGHVCLIYKGSASVSCAKKEFYCWIPCESEKTKDCPGVGWARCVKDKDRKNPLENIDTLIQLAEL
jgi:hypothetical protein